MNKTLLLAGIATIVSFNASAFEMKPYVGLDYAYSKAKMNGIFDNLKDKYNSGIVSVGNNFNDYYGVEAFFQQADEESKSFDGTKIKSKFHAYGLDVLGYMPLDCDGKFDLVGSLGLANYEVEAKALGHKESEDKIGYRAGVGAQYNFDENWSARLMARYSYLDMDSVDNLQEVTLGARYNF